MARGKIGRYKDPLESDMREIFSQIKKIDLGPFRLRWDDDYNLYLQVKEMDEKKFKTLFKWCNDGDIERLGANSTQNASLSMDNEYDM